MLCETGEKLVAGVRIELTIEMLMRHLSLPRLVPTKSEDGNGCMYPFQSMGYDGPTHIDMPDRIKFSPVHISITTALPVNNPITVFLTPILRISCTDCQVQEIAASKLGLYNTHTFLSASVVFGFLKVSSFYRNWQTEIKLIRPSHLSGLDTIFT